MSEKIAQKKIIEEEKIINNYFKSKIQGVVEEEEEKEKERQIREDPKLIRSELIKKRDKYSKSVRQNHLPKANDAKHKELEDLM